MVPHTIIRQLVWTWHDTWLYWRLSITFSDSQPFALLWSGSFPRSV